jgi:hypothetical protein
MSNISGFDANRRSFGIEVLNASLTKKLATARAPMGQSPVGQKHVSSASDIQSLPRARSSADRQRRPSAPLK